MSSGGRAHLHRLVPQHGGFAGLLQLCLAWFVEDRGQLSDGSSGSERHEWCAVVSVPSHYSSSPLKRCLAPGAALPPTTVTDLVHGFRLGQRRPARPQRRPHPPTSAAEEAMRIWLHHPHGW